MNPNTLPRARVQEILSAATKTRVLVVGDVMLDQFIWGSVTRISPEAPVPVLEFSHESYMPGGAANVARNLSALKCPAQLFSVTGKDSSAAHLNELLAQQHVSCTGLVTSASRHTTIKSRIVAHQQQLVRVDRETKQDLDAKETRALLAAIEKQLGDAAAM